MSLVTNTILSMWICEDYEERLKEVNEFFDKDTQGFVSCDDKKLPRGWYGGTKMLEIHISIGAFNYLDIDELVEHIRGIKFRYPESVQLIVCEQHDDKFRIVEPFNNL